MKLFRHTCGACIYLGVFKDKYDLYYCRDDHVGEEGDSVVVRFADEPHAYASMHPPQIREMALRHLGGVELSTHGEAYIECLNRYDKLDAPTVLQQCREHIYGIMASYTETHPADLTEHEQDSIDEIIGKIREIVIKGDTPEEE